MALLAQICQGVEWSLGRARTESGHAWERVTGATDEDQESPLYEDGRFRFTFDGSPRTPSDGTSGTFILPFAVLLYRSAPGHPMDDEPVFLDDLACAAAAVENGSYPPGVACVFVDEVSMRPRGGLPWLVGVLRVRAMYDAALVSSGEAPQPWTPGAG